MNRRAFFRSLSFVAVAPIAAATIVDVALRDKSVKRNPFFDDYDYSERLATHYPPTECGSEFVMTAEQMNTVVNGSGISFDEMHRALERLSKAYERNTDSVKQFSQVVAKLSA